MIDLIFVPGTIVFFDLVLFLFFLLVYFGVGLVKRSTSVGTPAETLAHFRRIPSWLKFIFFGVYLIEALVKFLMPSKGGVLNYHYLLIIFQVWLVTLWIMAAVDKRSLVLFNVMALTLLFFFAQGIIAMYLYRPDDGRGDDDDEPEGPDAPEDHGLFSDIERYLQAMRKTEANASNHLL